LKRSRGGKGEAHPQTRRSPSWAAHDRCQRRAARAQSRLGVVIAHLLGQKVTTLSAHMVQSASPSRVEPVGAFGEVVLVDASGIQTAAAAADVAAVVGDTFDHPVEVVVAGGDLLVGYRAGDGVAEQEHPHLVVVALRQGAAEAQPVVGPFGPVGAVVEDQQRLHGGHSSPTATGRPARRHSGIPSASRRALNPLARSRSTA